MFWFLTGVGAASVFFVTLIVLGIRHMNNNIGPRF